MTLRIGGEFELSLTSLAKPCVSDLPTLPGYQTLWVDSGRSALLLALEDILKRGGSKEAWLPAYICPSVIAPFRALGFSLNFYSGEGLLDFFRDNPAPARSATFLFVHYFGRKNTAAAAWLKAQQTPRQFFVIEDCVQASLNNNVADMGDYVLTSYRKFLPQPDGALLGSRNVLECELAESDEVFVSAKLVGKLLRHSAQHDKLYLSIFEEAEKRLDALKARKMSWLSSFLMQRTDIKKVVRTRRNNWRSMQRLLFEHGLLDYLTPLIDTLAAGEAPLGLPVKVCNGRRDDLRRALAAQKIYCPVHWQLDHLQNCAHDYPDEIALSQEVMTLPIDQRLRKTHLEHMAKTLSTYFKQNKS